VVDVLFFRRIFSSTAVVLAGITRPIADRMVVVGVYVLVFV